MRRISSRYAERPRDRQELDVWPELHAVADRHRSAVEENAADVGVEALTHTDVGAVVAVERRLDQRSLSKVAEELAQDLTAVICVFSARGVVPG